MLSNAYVLAKFRFDTAEKEPAKNLQKFSNKIANSNKQPCARLRVAREPPGARVDRGWLDHGDAAHVNRSVYRPLDRRDRVGLVDVRRVDVQGEAPPVGCLRCIR